MTQKSLLDTWTLLGRVLLEDSGPVSLRMTLPDDPFLDVLRLNDGELVELAPGQEAQMRAMLQAFQNEGLFYDSDAVLLTPGAIVSSRTELCLEQDISLHRRLGHDGALIGCDHIFPAYFSDGGMRIDPDQVQLYICDDAIGVVLHDPREAQSLQMTYLGSFDMDQAELPCPAQEQQDDEKSLSFICDMHSARNGLRSATIRRCAMTAEGPTRSVIFNDLYQIAA